MTSITFIEAMDKIKKAYHAKCSELIKDFDLSYVDFALIMFFANNKDKTTAKEFCKIRNIKPNVVSLHVDKLVSNDYLERELDAGDRRKINLTVTSKCDEIIKQGRKMQKSFYLSLTNGLTKEDIDEFHKSLQVILNNVSNL